jgi:Flp pilus assembly secretin CpaC
MVVIGGVPHAALALVAVLLSSCVTTRSSPPPEEGAEKRLAEWSAGHAVEDGVQRQIAGPGAEARARGEATDTTPAPGEPLWIQSGKSRILHFSRPVQRVSIGDPEVAGVVVLGPRTIMVNGKALPKAPGGEGAGGSEMRIATISNRPFTTEPRLAETTLAVWEAGAGAPVIHPITVGDSTNQQVMLEVTVAEINRTAMEEHGIDFRKIGDRFVTSYFLGGGAAPLLGTTVPPQINQPLLPLGLDSVAPQYVFQIPQTDITTFIKLLQTEGLASILAQPKILAMSGQPAVFQVGGEIPIRIISGFAADVQFKPFGTLVNFVPRVSDDGDIILTVTPEVSQPDFANDVEGVPSFITRRASTSARLRNGETLVIGGLMQTQRVENVRGVPYFMNIPFLGYIFRDTRYDSRITEMMVLVTPHLVGPLPPGTELALPTDRGPFKYDEVKTQYDPAEVTRPRVPEMMIKPWLPW